MLLQLELLTYISAADSIGSICLLLLAQLFFKSWTLWFWKCCMAREESLTCSRSFLCHSFCNQ